jgi:hypothetical protein
MSSVDSFVADIEGKLKDKIKRVTSNENENVIYVRERTGPCYNGVTNYNVVEQFYNNVYTQLKNIHPNLSIDYKFGTSTGPCGTTWTFKAPAAW